MSPEFILCALFFCSVFLLVYPFLVYPLLLMLMRKVHGSSRIDKAPFFPLVTVIVPTFGEARVIGRRIDNIFLSEYPHEKLELIVSDDGSTDGTREEVRRVMSLREHLPLRLVQSEEREGKVSAINKCLPNARGDVVIIADAQSLYEPDAIRRVLENFSDPNVGAVTGRYGFPNRDSETMRAEGIVWDYKNWLRRLEGDVDSTTFFSGALCAFRRELLDDLDGAVGDDSYIPCYVRRRGRRAVVERGAVFYERKPATFRELRVQKMRAAQTGMIESWRFRRMLLNPRYGLFGLLIFPARLLITPLSPLLLILAAIFGAAWMVQSHSWNLVFFLFGVFILGAFLSWVVTGKYFFGLARAFLFNEFLILGAFVKCLFFPFDVRWEKAETLSEE